jgi:diguanylate cyclase (GGDEF)-like protein/PAS domain S-box-containing protein
VIRDEPRDRHAAERHGNDALQDWNPLNPEVGGVIVWRADPGGSVLEGWRWNEFSGEFFARYKGRGWLDLIHADDRERVVSGWREAASRARPYLVECRVRHPDGKYRWSRFRSVPLYHPDGSLREWIGMLADIHQQQETTLARAASEERLRLAVDSTGLGIWDHDLQTDAREWSPEMRALLGLSLDASIGRKAFLERVHAEDRAWVEKHFYDAPLGVGRGRLDCEFRVVRANTGEERWIAACQQVSLDDEGKPARIIGTLRDITAGKSAEARLRASEERFRKFAWTSPDAFVCINALGQITFWNDGAARIFGFASYEVLGRSITILIPERLRAGHDDGITRALAGTEDQARGKTVELTALHRAGHEVPIEMSVSSWFEGEQLCLGAVVRDITERKRRKERLRRLANYDHLTQLPNRRLLWERMTTALAEAQPAMVLLLDLNGFKEVNDRYGHAAGDQILRKIARRLTASVPSGATVARFGGDELAIFISGSGDPMHASEVSSGIHASLSEPFTIDGQLVQVGTSIGIAIAPAHGTAAEEVMMNADLALYRAKSEGRSTTRLYTPQLRQQRQARRSLEAELRRAFERGEFELFYQPQVTMRERAIIGAEALLRWRHPERGLLAPAAFLSVLAVSPIAALVGDWTISEACRQAATLGASGFPIRMAINLFSNQFRKGGLAAQMQQVIAQTGLEPEQIELEVTEDVILENDATILRNLNELRSLGIGIAFDDYGTGYASLSMLKQFPLTKLKIDRSFVRNLELGSGDAAIVEAVVKLGATFGLTVIAEGVETEHHESMLLKLGCEQGQGYFYSKPVPAHELMQLLQHGDAEAAVRDPLHMVG